MNETNDSSKDKKPDFIEVKHRPSPNFTSEYATGAFIVGPTVEDMYFLTFFADSAEVTKEIGVPVEILDADNKTTIGVHSLRLDNDDVEAFREDKVRLTISKKNLVELKDLLIRQGF